VTSESDTFKGMACTRFSIALRGNSVWSVYADDQGRVVAVKDAPEEDGSYMVTEFSYPRAGFLKGLMKWPASYKVIGK